MNRIFFSFLSFRYTAITLFFALVVSSCSSPPPANVELNSQQHQASLADLTQWQIKGKFGFKNAEKKQGANLSWIQKSEDYRFALNTILGTSIMSLQGKPGDVSMVIDDKTYTGSNASELVWQMTGWSLPIEQLPTWIKGQSLNTDKTLLSKQGWIFQLEPSCINCKGWILRYDDYQPVQQYWLPHKIILSHKVNQVQVTIKVNSWTLN